MPCNPFGIFVTNCSMHWRIPEGDVLGPIYFIFTQFLEKRLPNNMFFATSSFGAPVNPETLVIGISEHIEWCKRPLVPIQTLCKYLHFTVGWWSKTFSDHPDSQEGWPRKVFRHHLGYLDGHKKPFVVIQILKLMWITSIFYSRIPLHLSPPVWEIMNPPLRNIKSSWRH